MTPSHLSKDMIFSQTTSEDIYKKFLNLPTIPKGNISSPFSEDQKPSFKLYPNGTFKCYSTGKQGDVYQLVADLNLLDCKAQFNEVLNIVAAEMKLITETTANCKINPIQLKKETKIVEKLFVLAVSNSEMQKHHFAFWNNLGVEKEILELYNVRAVAKYSFFSSAKNKELSFTIKDAVLAFSYEVKDNFEVYLPAQPNKNQAKTFCNGLQKGDIFGIEQLGTEIVENLIICAGKKDVVVAVSRGFKAVTFSSEAHSPTIDQIEILKNRCNNLFICYDNDKGGVNGRIAIVKRFPNIIPLILPTTKINGYDITDYFQEHLANDFQKMIDLVITSKK